MAADPAKRQLRCPSCGRLTPLDDAGRFVVHSLPVMPFLPGAWGWCPMSGREPGRIEVAKVAKPKP